MSGKILQKKLDKWLVRMSDAQHQVSRSKSQLDGLLHTKVVTERQTTSNISASAEATGILHVAGGLKKKKNTQISYKTYFPPNEVVFIVWEWMF